MAAPPLRPVKSKRGGKKVVTLLLLAAAVLYAARAAASGDIGKDVFAHRSLFREIPSDRAECKSVSDLFAVSNKFENREILNTSFILFIPFDRVKKCCLTR